MALKGDGVTVAYTLPFTPTADSRVLIFVERVQKVLTTDWSLTGKTITFTSPGKPGNGQRGVIYYETSRSAIV